MVNYTCTICLKHFKQKGHFIDHTEKRKNPCQPKNIETSIIPPENGVIIDSYSCKNCGEVFKRKDNLKRHIDKRCKKKNNETISLKKEIQTYKKEIEELKKLFYELSEKQKILDELKIIFYNHKDEILKLEC
jgi:uncharacterized Zn-finger protein